MAEINVTLDKGENVVEVHAKRESPVINVEVIGSGPQGTPGADGYSPTITTEEITGGHRLTIIDKDHPEGQTVDVMDGQDGQDGADGYTPVKGVDYFDGQDGADGYTPVKGVDYFDGADGNDGVSPTVSVTTITGGHQVDVTDAGGTTSFNVMDGTNGTNGTDGGTIWRTSVAPTENVLTYAFNISDLTGRADLTPAVGDIIFYDTAYYPINTILTTVAHCQKTNKVSIKGDAGTNGTDGQDGVSPEVTIASITGGHSVTITDADHPGGQSFNVMDGQTGPAGPGVPNGGSTGQMLVKNSGTDQDTKWDSNAYRASSIPFGECDNTSTNTAFTATVPGITELRDGVCMWLKNGAVTSAAGFTLNINGLGAKPVYSNMSAATAESTMFNANYTFFFVYDSTRVAGGCWVLDRGYDSNTNTIGYQLRTNKVSLPVSDKTYRYRLLFTAPDGKKFVPANTSSSSDATTAKTPNTRKIDPFGRITYYGSTTTVSSGSRPSVTTLWDQYEVVLGYSFNWTGAALTLTSWNPVYLKCAPQSDGSAIMDSTAPIVQSLPSTADGKIYVFLGIAYDATHIELYPWHPVYYYDGGIRLWTNPKAETDPVFAASPAYGISAADIATWNSAVQPSDLSYIVNLIPTNPDDFSGYMDKTVAEIYAAHLAGKQVFFRVWTGQDTYVEAQVTMHYVNGGQDYPSINAFILGDTPFDCLIYAHTGTTDDGTYNYYGTTIYPLYTHRIDLTSAGSIIQDFDPMPCPWSYAFGELAELSVYVEDMDKQYHLSFESGSTPTLLSFTGNVYYVAGDTVEANKYYEVDIWNGVALIKNIEVTAI